MYKNLATKYGYTDMTVRRRHRVSNPVLAEILVQAALPGPAGFNFTGFVKSQLDAALETEYARRIRVKDESCQCSDARVRL